MDAEGTGRVPLRVLEEFLIAAFDLAALASELDHQAHHPRAGLGTVPEAPPVTSSSQQRPAESAKVSSSPFAVPAHQAATLHGFKPACDVAHVQQCLASVTASAVAAAVPAGSSSTFGGPPEASALPATHMTVEQYVQWSKHVKGLQHTLSCLLAAAGRSHLADEADAAGVAQARGSVSSSSSKGARPPIPLSLASRLVMPTLHHAQRIRDASLLLQPLWAWLLAHSLTKPQQQHWNLLFCSRRDGKSFNTLMGRLTAHPGPTLLILQVCC